VKHHPRRRVRGVGRREDPIEDAAMKVNVRVQRRTEAVDECGGRDDAPGVPRRACGPALARKSNQKTKFQCRLMRAARYAGTKVVSAHLAKGVRDTGRAASATADSTLRERFMRSPRECRDACMTAAPAWRRVTDLSGMRLNRC